VASKSFENPLLSHARMRGLYRGLLEVRALRLVPRGFEACLVAVCIDLRLEDFVFSNFGQKAAAYIRQLGARTGNGAPRPASVRRTMNEVETRFAGTAQDGLLCAAGAAMALKAAHSEEVAITLIGSEGLDQASWERALRVTGAADLPLIIMALPDAGRVDWVAAGKRTGMPVIPVDAADAVAIYRVAQEALVRARADRRGAVIECVPSKTNPVRLMGEQLVTKGIANQRWIDSVDAGFKQMLERAR
jgi:TPP-dependent pyruvate/acetoin dehydrogenase alpha subunit